MSCQCRPDGVSATPPQSQHLRNLRNLWSFLSRFIVRRVCLLCLPRRGAWWECTARWCGARVSTLALVAGLRATDWWVLQRVGRFSRFVIILPHVFKPSKSSGSCFRSAGSGDLITCRRRRALLGTLQCFAGTEEFFSMDQIKALVNGILAKSFSIRLVLKTRLPLPWRIYSPQRQPHLVASLQQRLHSDVPLPCAAPAR